MVCAAMDDHIEELESLIKDNNSIVTVPSFASTVHISFAEAQQAIDKYAETNTDLHRTYIVLGQKKGAERSVVLVNDKSLSKELEQYESKPVSTTFSMQKGNNVDYSMISLVEDDLTEQISGMIIGKNCVKRQIKKKVLPTLPPATIKGKSTIFMKQKSVEAPKELPSNVNDNKNIKKEAEDTKGKGQGSLKNMFNNVKPKSADTKTVDSKSKPSAGMSISLSKPTTSSDKPQPKITATVKPETSKAEEAKSTLFDSDTDEDILKDFNIPAKKSPETKKTVKPTKKKSKTQANKSTTKRKRIIVEENSDSDDIFGSEKSGSEDVIEVSMEEEKKPVITKPLPPKNKRRKSVKKMYQDEDGFVVTQTEYTYETASEDENESNNKVAKVEPPKKPATLTKKPSSNSENEVSPNKGAKNKKGTKKAQPANQPTLMNFFKKK